MAQFPFLPASQPMTSTSTFVFPQSLQGPSSHGLPPTSQHRLPDATNSLDLRLPPDTLGMMAADQTSGRLPELFNGSAGQAVKTAKTVAAAKRKTARLGTQPNMWKAGSASTYPGGMPAPMQVAQLSEVAQPQPLSVKARARRIARAARYKKNFQQDVSAPHMLRSSQCPDLALPLCLTGDHRAVQERRRAAERIATHT
jgi:hypothetical protein